VSRRKDSEDESSIAKTMLNAASVIAQSQPLNARVTMSRWLNLHSECDLSVLLSKENPLGEGENMGSINGALVSQLLGR
jgi:hypothetical protein